MFVSNAKLRQRLGELAVQVGKSGQAIDAGSNPRRPTYRLIAVEAAPHPLRDRAIPLGVDQLRKWFSTIRWVVRADDVAIGVLVNGRTAAILHRHPKHFSEALDQLRTMARQQQEAAAIPTLTARLESIERMLERALAPKRRGRPTRTEHSAPAEKGTTDAQ